MLKNLQDTLFTLKIMFKNTADNKYSTELHTDISKPITKVVAIINLVEGLIVDDDDEKDKTNTDAHIKAIATKVDMLFEVFNTVNVYYTRFRGPQKGKAKRKGKADEEEGADE